jgi:hypothetical protein
MVLPPANRIVRITESIKDGFSNIKRFPVQCPTGVALWASSGIPLFSAAAFLNFIIRGISSPTQSRKANKSDLGKDSHTPVNWKKWGRAINKGVKNNNGRDMAMINVGITCPIWLVSRTL